MTSFSGPTALPWPKDLPAGVKYDEDEVFFPAGQVVKVSDDTALVAWGARKRVESDTYSYVYAEMQLAAVRHTNDGPIIGPVLTLTPPPLEDPVGAKYALEVDGLIDGKNDNEAWIVAGCYHSMWRLAGGAISGLSAVLTRKRVGRAVVDPATLRVSFTWRYTVPMDSYNTPCLVEGWAAQDRLLLVGNMRTGTNTSTYAIYMLDLRTGTVVAQVTPPIARTYSNGATGTAVIYAISLHPDGYLAVLGGNYDPAVSRYKTAVWVAPIAPGVVDAWEWRGNSKHLTPYGASLSSTSDGWVAVHSVNTYQYEALTVPKAPGGQLADAARHLTFDWNQWSAALGYYWRERARVAQVAHDPNRGILIFALAQNVMDSDNQEMGTGIFHTELTALDQELSHTKLPRSHLAYHLDQRGYYNPSNKVVDVATLPNGGYVYLASGAGIMQPKSAPATYEAFEMLVHVGGTGQTPGLDGAMVMETVEERSNFRRMN